MSVFVGILDAYILNTCATVQQATRNQASITADPLSHTPHIQGCLRSAMHKNVFKAPLDGITQSNVQSHAAFRTQVSTDLGIKMHC